MKNVLPEKIMFWFSVVTAGSFGLWLENYAAGLFMFLLLLLLNLMLALLLDGLDEIKNQPSLKDSK